MTHGRMIDRGVHVTAKAMHKAMCHAHMIINVQFRKQHTMKSMLMSHREPACAAVDVRLPGLAASMAEAFPAMELYAMMRGTPNATSIVLPPHHAWLDLPPCFEQQPLPIVHRSV